MKVRSGVVSGMYDGTEAMLMPIVDGVLSLPETETEGPYPDEFPGRTLDEYMASWDELIREVRSG